jgi:predicted DsbA family dithiol-disulfide isomerase
LAERYPKWNIEELHEAMRVRGAKFGLEFSDYRLLSNTHIALQAAEFARDQDLFRPFHEGLFRAYFGRGQDIGRREVVAEVAEACGLVAADLLAAVEDRRYEERLSQTRHEARRWLLEGVPTFIVNGEHKIVGAQPLDVFRSVLGPLAQ